jgi:hypothetical protein
MMRPHVLAVTGACVLAASLELGCTDERNDAPFEHLFYRNVSSAPGTVSLRPNEIRIERGLAVRARVTAMGSNGEPLDLLDLSSSDPETFVVDLGPRLGEFVFHGVRPGNAEIDVFSDRNFKGSVPVEVIEQSP